MCCFMSGHSTTLNNVVIIAEREKLREVSPLLKNRHLPNFGYLLIYITIILLRRFYLPQGQNYEKIPSTQPD